MRGVWHLIACLCFFLNLAPCYAKPSPQNPKEKLQVLENKLNAIERNIKSYRDELSTYESKLKGIDSSIAQTNKKVDETATQISKTKAEINALTQTLKTLEVEYEASLMQLQAYIKELHQHQNEHPLKLILQQKKIIDVQKLGVWYEYFAKAHGTFIKDLIEKTQKTTQAKDKHLAQQNKLAALEKDLSLQLEQLSQEKQQQEQLIAHHQKSLQDEVYHQKYFKKQHQLLSKLIAQLDEAATLEYLDVSKKFSAMAGKLPSPIRKTDILNKDMTQRYFEAKEGASVQAIHPGRVVFSEWLRGLGLLLIIDHGQGYMSLYGNNEVLLKSTGDWVNQGEKIAVVGKSGGQSKPGLYFEIRKDGSPLDTMRWIQSG